MKSRVALVIVAIVAGAVLLRPAIGILEGVSYWHGLVVGGAASVAGFVGAIKSREASVWRYLALVAFTVGGSAALVAATRLM